VRIQRVIPFVFGLCLLTLGNGCATKALWQNGNLEAWNQAAADPRLSLYASKEPADVLVLYDEYHERSDATRTRAYWLNENQKLLEQHQAPHFVSANAAIALTALPVFPASTNLISLPPAYAIVATNGQSFTLHLEDGAVESHDLPVYNDHKGKIEKFALTPLATAADATILAGFLGYLYLGGVNSNYNPSY
jgi:hypothetical protein